MKAGRIFVCILAGLAIVPAWAGREFTLKPGEQAVSNQLLIKLKPGAPAAAIVNAFLRNATVRDIGLPNHYVISAPGGIPPGISTALAAHNLVDFVEPDHIRTVILATPNDTYYTNSSGTQWGLFTVQALQAWNYLQLSYLTSSTPATGRVPVAVLDTGADCGHPDFINSGGASTDSAAGGQLMWSASRAFVATTVASPACSWQDDHGHGTHVAGIVAAATSNAAGVASLGFPLQVMVFKVLDASGSGADSTIANAIVTAADAGARVISMSLGGAGYSQTLQSAIDYAWQKNVVVVAAAGNGNSSALTFPGDANHALAIAASDVNNARASFANFGNAVAVAAPGVSILSTVPHYPVTLGCCTYGSLSGTSMATPFVSALAGLVAIGTPGTSAAAVVQRIEQTAASPGNVWDQNFGYGIINAFNAVTGLFRPTATGSVVGQVVDGSGLPVSGTISLDGQTAAVDSTGLFWFRSVAPGSHTVSVSATGFTPQNLTAMVAAGSDTPLTVTMGVSYGVFTGTVTDHGSPVSGAIVQAVSSGAIAGTAVAGANGQFTLWVPAGSAYTVQASLAGSNTASVSGLSVNAGNSTTVNLTMVSLLGAVAGQVADTSLNPLPGSQVTVSSASFSATATTAADGTYTVPRVPPGAYTVTASNSGAASGAQNGVSVSADATTAVNFQLTPLAASAPAFSPTPGTYATSTNVTISSATPGVSIRYTTDGSMPTTTSGILYSGAIAVNSAVAFKAIAYSASRPASGVTTASYSIASAAWYSAGGTWSKRNAITIDHTKVAGDTANFPVLVSLSDATLQANAKPDGSDILFTASDGVTRLNHETEQYSNGTLAAWVKLPALSSAGDTVIYLYYGNPSATPQQNAAAVWDANYQGVWHLANSSSLAADSTVNANSGTAFNTTTATGKVGGAGLFDGASSYIATGYATAMGTADATMSGWVRSATTAAQLGGAFGTRRGSPTYAQFNLTITADVNGATTGTNPELVDFDINFDRRRLSTVNLLDGNWHYVVLERDADSSRMYIDGVLNGTSAAANRPNLLADHFVIGALGNGGATALSGHFFNGSVDEVRLSVGLARPAAWIATEYANQNAPASFYTVATVETAAGTVPNVVTSSPAGLTLAVDGANCVTPCSLQWAPGTTHTIAAATQAGPTGTQYVFAAWSDSGAVSHSVTAAASSATYTASFTTQYFLTTAASPPAGGSISPASAWYNAGSVVPVSAAANTGYTFSNFSGAVTGATTPQNVTLNAPASVTANFASTGGSGSWYSTGGTWTYRKAIVIDHTKVSGTLTHFPVLVSITDADLQANTKSDASDLVFTAADGVTKLAHEIESYNAASGQLTAWVAVPSLSSTADTSLFLYYGNAAATAQQNPAGVWDTNYKGVWHFASSSSLTLTDSTAGANNGSAVGAAAAASGKMGGAVSLNGASQAVNVGQSANLNVAGTFTIEAWVKPSQVSARYGVFSTRSGNAAGSWQLEVGNDNNGNADGGLAFTGPNTFIGDTAGGLLAANTWAHVVATKNGPGDTATVYVNGAPVALAHHTTYSASDNSNAKFIGEGTNGTQFFPGAIDEVRLSNAARSSAWIATEYANMSAPGRFLTAGAPQANINLVSITVASSPAGLTLTVDGSNCTAPCALQWTPGTSHTIAAATQAGATGTQYVFAAWSDSGAASHPVTAPGASATYTASFTTQYFLTTAASPSAGGSIGPVSGWFDAGSVVSITASANTGYTFAGFSGGLAGSTTPQNVTMSAPVSVTATFTANPVSITVASSPAGLTLTVDGSNCTAPCALQWAPGTSHTIAAATQAGATGTQYVFASWSDSGAVSHLVTAPGAPATYTASFTTQYFLTTAASPSAGGSIGPASGWYNSGSVVSVSATANSGFNFSGFSGAVTGAATPQNLTMTGPLSVTATFAQASGTWYSAGGTWTNRRAVTINHTRISGGAALSNFPVLISFTDTNLASVAKADGSDIVFTAADGVTKLNHEIDGYQSATGQLAAWVNIPSVSPAGDTVIYLYYGNPAAATQQNAPGVWDGGYKGVWHFGDSSTLRLADSTANGNNGVGAGSPAATAGAVGGAVNLSGAQAVDVGHNVSLNTGGVFTIEAWVKASSLATRFGVFSTRSANDAGSWQLEIGNDGNANGNGGIALTGPNTFVGDTAGGLLSAGTWAHVVAVKNGAGDTAQIYVNGVAAPLNHHAAYTAAGNTHDQYIGEGTNGTQFFMGAIDEVRLSNVVRTAGWIATEYRNLSAPGTFASLGAVEIQASSTQN